MFWVVDFVLVTWVLMVWLFVGFGVDFGCARYLWGVSACCVSVLVVFVFSGFGLLVIVWLLFVVLVGLLLLVLIAYFVGFVVLRFCVALLFIVCLVC